MSELETRQNKTGNLLFLNSQGVPSDDPSPGMLGWKRDNDGKRKESGFELCCKLF